MEVNAYAKINIGLDVVRRRPDGYHEVRMIMQQIGLHDVLYIDKEDKPGIRITTDREGLSTGEDNLIYKAAKLIMDEYDLTGGLSVNLEKKIPVAAGLAGGSTDAAATLIAVNDATSATNKANMVFFIENTSLQNSRDYYINAYVAKAGCEPPSGGYGVDKEFSHCAAEGCAVHLCTRNKKFLSFLKGGR